MTIEIVECSEVSPAVVAAFERLTPQLSRSNPPPTAEALAEILLYGQSGARFCAPRGVRVLEGAAGWIDRGDAAARDNT